METHRTLPKRRPAGRGVAAPAWSIAASNRAHPAAAFGLNADSFQTKARARVNSDIDLHALGAPRPGRARTTRSTPEVGRAHLFAPATDEDLSGSASGVPIVRSFNDLAGLGPTLVYVIAADGRPFGPATSVLRCGQSSAGPGFGALGLSAGEAHVGGPPPGEAPHLSQVQFDR
jgi:hypothetical protein